jgi:GT2 family glycosyltransferase
MHISVIIPAYYSTETIGGCLAALRMQTFSDFEIIVVNSSPEPYTEQAIRNNYPEVVFIQSRVRLLPHAARNQGVMNSRGDLLVFTDPDCEAQSDWLEHLYEKYKLGFRALVGSMELMNHSWWEEGVHLLKFHGLLSGLPEGTVRYAPTANAAYDRNLWEQIGPFPDHYYCGDGIFSMRAASAGHPPYFVPAAVVRHHHLDRGMKFWMQRFFRGRDNAHAQLKMVGSPQFLKYVKLLLSWVAAPLELTRIARDAYRCGWKKAYILTIPVLLAGFALWALGETYGVVEVLMKRIVEIKRE